MKIGVTGGIGSGKSYVCRLLAQRWQLPVYDCDSAAKMLMVSSPHIRQQLQELVGDDVYDAGGQLNKGVMSRYLFADAAHVKAVNAIVHPAVKDDFELWASQQTGDVVMESAILVEAGFAKAVDCLVVVEAPLALRIQRAMARDGATEEQVRARVRHQMTAEQLRAYADIVIVNDGRDLLSQLSPIVNYTSPIIH